MIPKECKRLAEVDFPIAVVSKHAAREKSIRQGHPSTLHLWWARRPLAACRAMLLGLLLPDPCDRHCPDDFKEQARELLSRVQGIVGPKDEHLRGALLKFLGDFANWDLSADRIYLEVGRKLIKAAHDEETPLVMDSFAGGGSIPLEALRLGCETFAADLNPLACLILKLMLEDIPRYGPELAEEFRRVGVQIKEDAEKQLAEFYPGNPNGAKPIAYLWARTVRCEAPDCGAEIPIFKTAWLSKKEAKRARYFKESADGDCIALLMESTPKGGPIAFRITRGHGSETPRPGFAPLRATKASGNNSNAVCPCCSTVLKGDRVMAQLAAQHTGCDALFDNDGTRVGGAYLLAVIEGRLQASGKIFRLPTSRDYQGAWKAAQKAKSVTECNPTPQLNPVRPSPNARGLTAPTKYGAQTFADLFTARQRLAIVTLAKVIENRIVTQGALDSVSLAVLLALGRCVDQTSAHVRWIPSIEAIASSFPRQALQMVWDFVESIPIGDQSANYGAAIEWIRKVIDQQGRSDLKTGQVQQADARRLSLPDESADAYFTDPPYYDAVPYADLSDFFLGWLKTALPPSATNFMHLDEGDGLSPKTEECVWNQAHEVDGKPKDPAFFEASVGTAFAEGCRALKNDGMACVVFAHKTTEGWEALLNGLLKAG
jgi:putative DNA methylase